MRPHLRTDYDSVKVLEEAMALPTHRLRYAEAIMSLYDGKSIEEVAAHAKVTVQTVRRWTSAFNQGGLEAVFEVGSGGVYDLHAGYTAEDLRAAADEALHDGTKAKLRAIALMYEGESSKEIARTSGVSISKLNEWRRDFNATGLRTHYKPGSNLQADLTAENRYYPPARVKDRLDNAKSEELKTKLRSVLMSYAGRSIDVICSELGVSRALVVSWIKVFNASGPNGLLAPDRRETASKGRPIETPGAYSKDMLREFARAADSENARKAFFALATLYEGHGFKEAAKQHRMKAGDLKKLLKRLGSGGPDAILKGDPLRVRMGKTPTLPEGMTIDEVEARGFAHPVESSGKRLLAIARICRGEDMEAVAAEHEVKPPTVVGWLKTLHERGFDGFPEERYKRKATPDRPTDARITELAEKRRSDAEDRRNAEAAEAARKRAHERRAKGPSVMRADAPTLAAVEGALFELNRDYPNLATPQRLRLEKLADYLRYHRDRDVVWDISAALFDKWLKSLERRGVATFTNHSQNHFLHPSIAVADIMAVADRQTDEQIALQLRGIAYFHAGSRIRDVEDDLGIFPGALTVWLTKFRDRGFEAVGIDDKVIMEAEAPETAAPAFEPPDTSPDPGIEERGSTTQLDVVEVDPPREPLEESVDPPDVAPAPVIATHVVDADTAHIGRKTWRRPFFDLEDEQVEAVADPEPPVLEPPAPAASSVQEPPVAILASAPTPPAEKLTPAEILRRELEVVREKPFGTANPRFKRYSALLGYFGAEGEHSGTAQSPLLNEWLRRFRWKGVAAFTNERDAKLLKSGMSVEDFDTPDIRYPYWREMALFYADNSLEDIEDDAGLPRGSVRLALEALKKDRAYGSSNRVKTEPAATPAPESTERVPTARPVEETARAGRGAAPRPPGRPPRVGKAAAATGHKPFARYPKYDRDRLVAMLTGTKDAKFAQALGSVIMAHDDKSMDEIVKVVGATPRRITMWVNAYSRDGIIGIAP